jgi:glutaminase
MAQAAARQGKVADRIPQLAKADPDRFSLQVSSVQGLDLSFGDVSYPFPIMSVVKSFTLLYLLEQQGSEQVFQWVGTQPSDAPFNSRQQLQADQGHPRNPMINSGAIALCDKLPGATGTDRAQQFCQWLNQQAGCNLALDSVMLDSVHEAGREPNLALLDVLQRSGAVTGPEIAIDTYEQVCCLAGTVGDLAALGMLLAQSSDKIADRHRHAVNAIMLTCGLYERSAEMAVQIGLPLKSGISGGLLAVVPGQGAIATYSSALDQYGNSIAGLTFMQECVQTLNLSIFH